MDLGFSIFRFFNFSLKISQNLIFSSLEVFKTVSYYIIVGNSQDALEVTRGPAKLMDCKFHCCGF